MIKMSQSATLGAEKRQENRENLNPTSEINRKTEKEQKEDQIATLADTPVLLATR